MLQCPVLGEENLARQYLKIVKRTLDVKQVRDLRLQNTRFARRLAANLDNSLIHDLDNHPFGQRHTTTSWGMSNSPPLKQI